MYRRIIRPLLFKLDPEFAHDVTIKVLSWTPLWVIKGYIRLVKFGWLLRSYYWISCAHLAYLISEDLHARNAKYTRLLRPRTERKTTRLGDRND